MKNAGFVSSLSFFSSFAFRLFLLMCTCLNVFVVVVVVVVLDSSYHLTFLFLLANSSFVRSSFFRYLVFLLLCIFCFFFFLLNIFTIFSALRFGGVSIIASIF